MKTNVRALMVLAVMAAFISLGSVMNPVQAQRKSSAIKIGTYDSRQVMLAYANSDQFKKKMGEVRKECEALLDSKDTVKMKEGAMKMIAFSYGLEKSVFSTASATSTINLLTEEFPGLAKQAGVSMIVSKWDLNYSDPKIEIVDVTPLMVALFDKAGTSKKTAGEILKQDPLTEEDYGMGESIDMWEQFKARYHFR